MSAIEKERVGIVQDLAIMGDGRSQEAYDRIARLAQEIFQTPVVLITFIDGQRQWFKAKIGTKREENTSGQSFCHIPIRTRKPLVVEDALADERFAGMEIVASAPHIRFYAGAPILTHEKHAIGTVCILDVKPRKITPRQVKMLEDLAAMVMTQVKADREIGRLDPMTRMPNRIQFLISLQDLVRVNPSARRWIVLVDLIHHRAADEVIGALGIDFYNEQIRSAATMLQQHLPGVTIYHIGGAYLVFLLPDSTRPPDALIQQLDADLRQPLVTSRGMPVALSPSFGIRPIGMAEMSTPDVLRTVITASREARFMDSVYAIYNTDRDQAHKRLFSLLTDMPKALRSKDQLRLVYQPRIDVQTGACIGAEALLRWKHPRWGDVPPAEFFPLVEQTGLIHDVTDWVMRNVVRQTAEWQKNGNKLTCSFNISSRNLLEDDLIERLSTTLQSSHLSPSQIEIELVEDMDLHNSHLASERLHAFRQLGIKVAIDDFGSGYSNMAYLLSLPASSLKIDRSLISKVLTDNNANVTVKTIIQLGHNLGYQIVAEGVESDEVATCLKEWGCDEAQGYFYARPMEVQVFESWLAASKLANPETATAL